MTDARPRITGVQISYYFICHRKLWLFSHNIQMEHTSEYVELGALLHEHSYARKRKEIELDGIKIDFFDKNRGLINEVKKSKSLEESHIWQLKYYLLYFRNIGLDVRGQIDYPKLRRREIVELSDEDEKKLKEVMAGIRQICDMEMPPDVIDRKFCKKCSYYELCYI